MPLTTSVFNLPAHLEAKADPALIAADEGHFAVIAETLESAIDEVSERLAVVRKQVGTGQGILERDLEIHRLTTRLRTLRRFGLDVCLGHIVTESGPVYIGRLGLTNAEGQHLLVDWRSPAAEPFFGATHADPQGLSSRRRYRWTLGRISDYWDEVFTTEGLEHNAALDDQSAFIASLGSNRSPRMRDVLGTIQADQDAIIRASGRGALVVDGGPGTGKTVVALHRTAYLLYSEPRLGAHGGGVLFVGPHEPYLAYVGDVLPSLGEDGVQTCTLRELVAEGATAALESDPIAVRLKASVDMMAAIEPAVRLFEEPPVKGLMVETPWAEVWLSADEWADAFETADPGIPHNEAREQVWEELIEILLDKHDSVIDERDEVPVTLLRRAFANNELLTRTFNKAWPLLEASTVLADLWSVPAFLRRCAPWLSPAEVALLQRADPRAWTVSDLPLLDAARRRIGDPDVARRRRHAEAAVAAEREYRQRVADDLLASNEMDDGEGLMTILRGRDAANSLVDSSLMEEADVDLLAGPFAHIVVDEAQELTDAEWQMLLQRCPSGSFTIVGDRAQARHGFLESWEERLERVGVRDVTMASLSINYRTPSEVMEEAEPVIRAALPDANVPTSIRSSGLPVVYGTLSERDELLNEWLSAHDEGIACVIGDATFVAQPRVQSLTPELSKGLEFDLVILVDPETWGDGIEGAVDRYVAMTRATQQLVILHTAS